MRYLSVVGAGGQRPARSRCSLIAVRASSVGVRSFRAAIESSKSSISFEILKGNCGFLFLFTIVFFFAMKEIMVIRCLSVNLKVLASTYLQLLCHFLCIL